MNIKMGIVGLSHFHIHMFLSEALKEKNVIIMGVSDEDPEIRKKNCMKYSTDSYENIDQLLQKADSNVIVTAAVNNKKADIIIKALKSGKTVIADKPLTTNLCDLDRIEKTMKETNNCKLYLMLTERYNPSVYTVKKLIDSGEIGDIVNLIFLRPHKLNNQTRPRWFFDNKAYGGLMNDLGVHDLDLLRWFTNSEVESIIGATKSNKRYKQYNDFEDNFEAMVRMKNGSTAFIRVDWLTPDSYPYHGDCRVIVLGTKGQIEAFTVGMHGSDNAGARVIVCTDEKAPNTVPLESRGFSMAKDFFNCVYDNDYIPVVKTEDAIESTRLALNIQSMINKNTI